MLITGKQKDSVREETTASFRHDENKRAKSTPKSAPPFEPPTEKDGRSTFEKKESQRPESIWEVCSTTVQRFHQR